MPQISVIMSVYREKPEWLMASIKSILRQTYTDFEFIIIVDDPKNVVLIKIVKTFAQKDSRIQLYINEKNRGLIKSLNRALDYCQGKYIARMDADDIAYTQRFEKQLNYLCEHSLDLVGSNIAMFKDDGKVFHVTDKLRFHPYLKYLLKYGAVGIVHPTFFAKAEVFYHLEGYALQALHAEDMEFIANAICAGYHVGNHPDVLLECRYSDYSVTKQYAWQMYQTATIIQKVFLNCLKEGKYRFDFSEKLSSTSESKEQFRKKQILMVQAREMLRKHRIDLFLWKIIQALYCSPSTLTSIKINLVFRLLRYIEKVRLWLQ